MNEQARDQPQWFAYRTHVALRGDKPRLAAWLRWASLAVGVVLFGIVTALVFVWLVSADVDVLLKGIGGLLGTFGRQAPPT